MGLMNAVDQWKMARHDKHISKMETQDKCPDCSGKGFQTYVTSSDYFVYDNSSKCPGCNGSGMYSDWADQILQ
jgi:DnaJ-class molecular chaperone